MKKIIFALCLGLILAACQKEDRSYQGPDYIEFSPSQFNQTISSNGLIQKDGQKTGLEVLVAQKIAYPVDYAQKVNFRIADVVYIMSNDGSYLASLPEGTDPSTYTVAYSTMEEGVDYTFDHPEVEGTDFDSVYQRGSTTIEPNNQFAYISLYVLQNSGKQLFVVLEESEDFIPNKYTRILRYTAAK